MAISLLTDDFEDQCDGNMFAEGFNKYHCKNCYHGIKNFSHFARQKDIFQDPRILIKKVGKFNQSNDNFISALFNLIKEHTYCKKDVINQLKDMDQTTIGTIKEALRVKLVSIASKLLNSEHSKLEDLSEENQNLWKQFDNSEIYEFITGEKDTLPEFQFNLIEPCQLAVHLPPGALLAMPQDLQDPPDQPKPQAPLLPALLPAQHPQPAPLAPQGGDRQDQPQPAQDQPPVAVPSGQQSQGQHDLRSRQDINYKELHTGIKQRCRKLCHQAKAVVTKLQSNLLQINLQTKDRHLNHRDPLVIISSTFIIKFST